MNKPLTNFDIMKYIKILDIPNFRGIFMRDNLPKNSRKIESVILNHDSIRGIGTHWTAFVKVNSIVYYFDPVGKLPPPLEVIEYIGPNTDLNYNYNQYQKLGTVICGQLCLFFLYFFWKE